VTAPNRASEDKIPRQVEPVDSTKHLQPICSHDINLISDWEVPLTLNQLRDVVAIAEFGAVRAAARHLDVPQPLLTRNLANLEREFGTKVFERRPQGMSPTVFGGIVIDGARRVLSEVEQLSSAITKHHEAEAAKRRKARTSKRVSVLPMPRDAERADHVFTDVVLEVFRLYARLMRAGDVMVRPVGLTSSRWQVLGALPLNKATGSEIARYMGLQRQSVQRTIHMLRREGLVSLVDNPGHRRARLAMLTESGRNKISEVNKIRDEWIRRSIVGISPAELEAAYLFLRRMRKRLGGHSLP
jgi:DNA-binding MarR family transcriptional regulator